MAGTVKGSNPSAPPAPKMIRSEGNRLITGSGKTSTSEVSSDKKGSSK